MATNAPTAPGPTIPVPQLPPAPPAPVAGPVPVPNRRAFRTANATALAPPTVNMVSFTKSTTRPPILSVASGYATSDRNDFTYNLYTPSFISMNVSMFFTNQQLSGVDQFLKENPGYHPTLFNAYAGFLYYLQICSVLKTLGSIIGADLYQMCCDILREYPPERFPVPGTIVHNLMAITRVDNPFTWLGPISPRLPDLTGANRNNDFRPNNYICSFIPSVLHEFAQFRAMIRRQRAQGTTVFNDVTSIRGEEQVTLNADSDSRMNLLVPTYQVPSAATLRVEQSAHAHYSNSLTDQAARIINFGLIDLPGIPAAAANAITPSYPQFFGLIDAPNAPNATNLFRRWPYQVGNIVSSACRFIDGSRYMSDITPVGIGACTDIAAYMAPILEGRDPRDLNAVPPQDGTLAQSVRNRYQPANLTCRIQTRDPEHEQSVTQLSLLAQINVDPILTIANPINPPAPLQEGPFWTNYIVEEGIYENVENMLQSGLPATIHGKYVN